jgi:hypothetical protein
MQIIFPEKMNEFDVDRAVRRSAGAGFRESRALHFPHRSVIVKSMKTTEDSKILGSFAVTATSRAPGQQPSKPGQYGVVSDPDGPISFEPVVPNVRDLGPVGKRVPSGAPHPKSPAISPEKGDLAPDES